MKEMPDACVTQLVRAVDQQSKVPGLNPGIVEIVSFSTKHDFKSFKFMYQKLFTVIIFQNFSKKLLLF